MIWSVLEEYFRLAIPWRAELECPSIHTPHTHSMCTKFNPYLILSSNVFFLTKGNLNHHLFISFTKYSLLSSGTLTIRIIIPGYVLNSLARVFTVYKSGSTFLNAWISWIWDVVNFGKGCSLRSGGGSIGGVGLTEVLDADDGLLAFDCWFDGIDGFLR